MKKQLNAAGKTAGPNKVGPPVKMTPEAMKKITSAISAGVPFSVAATLTGMDKMTIYRWIKQDKDFEQQVRAALAQAEARLVGVIANAAGKQWQAAAWILERHPKMRERWAKNSEIGLQMNSTISSQTTIVQTE